MDYDLGISIWRLECSKHSKIRSAQKLPIVSGTLYNPCLRAGPGETRNSPIDAGLENQAVEDQETEVYLGVVVSPPPF
jgi:hypothetical protein